MFLRDLITALTAIGLAAPAGAGEIVASGFDWSGAYFGVDAGFLSNDSRFTASVTGVGEQARDFHNSLTDDQSSLAGGALVGYNLQASNFVIGAQADLTYLGYSNSRSTLQTYDVYSATRNTTFDASWLGTLRGRAGLAASGFLVYGTAGLAAGNMQATAKLTAIDVETGDTMQWKGSTDATQWGWVAGAGVEYGISNVSFGLEYLYVDLGSERWSGKNISGLDVTSQASGTAHYQFSLTTATARLHF